MPAYLEFARKRQLRIIDTHMIRAFKARLLPTSKGKEGRMVAAYIVKSTKVSISIPTDDKLYISQSVVSSC